MTVKRTHLKILHVLGQLPDATGSGIYLQAMMREAAVCGHENFMIAGIQTGQDVELQGVVPGQCRFVRFDGGDIPFRIPGMTDVMPYPSTRFADLSESDVDTYETVFTRVLTDVVTAFRPDIIHSHHLWLVSSLARRLFPKIPVVATCHGTDLRQFQNCPHLRDRVVSGCGRLSAAMALGASQKQDIEGLYRLPPERVVVTGAGYSDTLFTSGAKPAPRPVQLVYAGKLLNAKGLPWLLKALKTIPAPEWQLHLVGGGSGMEKDECLRLARDLGERVVIHGQIPQKRLAALFKTSHIFVLSSFFEGLPLVVLEALASGCRVVATDLPGVLEVVGDCNVDYISLVRTPRLRKMDQPYPEDLAAFEQDLARALDIQIAGALRHPQIDLAPIEDTLAAFTWSGIFAKVQQVYFKVHSPEHRLHSESKRPPVEKS
ncbi:Glycosyl transferase [Olavius algarvensis associated proteobacterium Delta 3]|nr:Glycosyl transferase [Olavius algarvensis associated proteobacterium Delta 3]CAB5172078.1 Glycosyl transferase [Olavius algarvensis associated proteobacterium Delta 3]